MRMSSCIMSLIYGDEVIMAILVTGGTGFIGSHTVVELIAAGFEVVIIDNLSNSRRSVIDRIEVITGERPTFYLADLRDEGALKRIFSVNYIEAVVHFAGLKSVAESVERPLDYYDNNIVSTLMLCKAMREAGVKKIVFSSSATVYGDPQKVPVSEDAPLNPINPYGRTKLIIENILRDLQGADREWKVVLLRYFNPVGAHATGLLGEDPRGIPNNLMPIITQVAVGKRDKLFVFGRDYPTPDGTAIRDYVHVVDLARGHVQALKWLFSADPSDVLILNLGTGRGYSVLEVIKAFEEASGRAIPYEFTVRRPGDVPVIYADPSRAMEVLHWEAHYDLKRMCIDAWRWQFQNPSGYPY
ncbi:MAG: UDP-glucose 4-epimerase GalE [Syntrophales bacterium]|nr:UDP-glucose 4-epimerase GalE [Syntrophales bacterium]